MNKARSAQRFHGRATHRIDAVQDVIDGQEKVEVITDGFSEHQIKNNVSSEFQLIEIILELISDPPPFDRSDERSRVAEHHRALVEWNLGQAKPASLDFCFGVKVGQRELPVWIESQDTLRFNASNAGSAKILAPAED